MESSNLQELEQTPGVGYTIARDTPHAIRCPRYERPATKYYRLIWPGAVKMGELEGQVFRRRPAEQYGDGGSVRNTGCYKESI